MHLIVRTMLANAILNNKRRAEWAVWLHCSLTHSLTPFNLFNVFPIFIIVFLYWIINWRSARNLFGGRAAREPSPACACIKCRWRQLNAAPSQLSLHRVFVVFCMSPTCGLKGVWKDLPRIKLECLYAPVRTIMLIAVETRANCGLCARKRSGRSPRKTWKITSGWRKRSRGIIKGREGELEMVHLVHKEAWKCEEVRVISGIVLLCLIIWGNLVKWSKWAKGDETNKGLFCRSHYRLTLCAQKDIKSVHLCLILVCLWSRFIIYILSKQRSPFTDIKTKQSSLKHPQTLKHLSSVTEKGEPQLSYCNYKLDIGRSSSLQPGQTSEPAVGSMTAQLAGVSHFASLATGSELSDQNDHR